MFQPLAIYPLLHAAARPGIVVAAIRIVRERHASAGAHP